MNATGAGSQLGSGGGASVLSARRQLQRQLQKQLDGHDAAGVGVPPAAIAE